MTFNFLGPGLTVNVEAKVKEQIILDSSDLMRQNFSLKTTIFISVRERTFRLSQRQNNLRTEVGRNNPTLLTIFSRLL